MPRSCTNPSCLPIGPWGKAGETVIAIDRAEDHIVHRLPQILLRVGAELQVEVERQFGIMKPLNKFSKLAGARLEFELFEELVPYVVLNLRSGCREL